MKSIKPQLTAVLLAHTIPDRVASDDGLIVNSYKELRKYVAELSCKNKDCILFYRGQKEDYKNSKSKSTFYPTIYRGEPLSADELAFRWRKLKSASKLLVDKIKAEKISEKDLLIRKKLLQWSIIQHYEVTETPLIDVTQSLRVACSFAQLDNANNYAYIYAFALPYYTNRISVNSEQYLTNIRLLSVAPPEALRPYFQEGFLIGEDEINETYTNKSELDLNNRLIAKFKIPNNNNFWGISEKAICRDDLYPDNDKMDDICQEIKAELYNNILPNEVPLSDMEFGSFMLSWTKLEELLMHNYCTTSSNRPTVLNAIQNIADQNLRNKLNKMRNLLNLLVHNPKGFGEKMRASILGIDMLLKDLQDYYK